MKFHLMQTGVVGRRHEIEQGMAGQRPELYQRFLEEVRGYVQHADELGFYGYCQPEHHLQIEGFEIGREHVRTPVTNAHFVCRIMLIKKKQKNKINSKSQ